MLFCIGLGRKCCGRLHSCICSALIWRQKYLIECPAGNDWRLKVTVCGLQYELTAADILKPIEQGTHRVFGVMSGHLRSACFSHGQPARMVRKGCIGCCLVVILMLSVGNDLAAVHLI